MLRLVVLCNILLHLFNGQFVIFRIDAEQGVPFSLSQVRLRVYRHEQGGGPSAAASEIRLDPSGGFREVHSESNLQGAQLSAQRQTDSLSLPPVPICRIGIGPNVGAQIQAHGGITTIQVLF